MAPFVTALHLFLTDKTVTHPRYHHSFELRFNSTRIVVKIIYIYVLFFRLFRLYDMYNVSSSTKNLYGISWTRCKSECVIVRSKLNFFGKRNIDTDVRANQSVRSKRFLILRFVYNKFVYNKHVQRLFNSQNFYSLCENRIDECSSNGI